MEDFKDIARLLRKNIDRARKDGATFLCWERGDISTETMIEQFKENNLCKSVAINEDHFVRWVRSLGYGLQDIHE